MENNNSFSLKSLSSDEINKIEEFRKSKRTAVLVILFSDIVNSTYATEKLGEQSYAKLRYIHDELFKKIMCRDNAGVIIKEIGDSFLCVFAEPSTAVLRAVEFQRAVHSNKEHLTAQHYTLSVRIGIHVGQVAVENALALDIFGRHVNRASRIEAIAYGGQILTSQSIWENTVGWLKDNNEEKIGWIAYGKTRLKGIDERVDIFGFYPKEIGKLPTPQIIRKHKQKQTLLLVSALIILLVLSVILFKHVVQVNVNKKTISLSTERKTYYVQFDFSKLKPSKEKDRIFLDTVSLQEVLMAQIIAVLYPDSVITERDLIDLLAKKGTMYVRQEMFGAKNYIWDSLKISRVLVIEAGLKSETEMDSLLFSILMTTKRGESLTNSIVSVKNIANEFRADFQDLMNPLSHAPIQAVVINCKDSIVLFQLEVNAKLTKGAYIEFSKIYSGKEGQERLLKDIKEKMDYYQSKPEYYEMLKATKLEYDKYEKDSIIINGGAVGYLLGTKGKVVELYDSTGIAVLTLKGVLPWDQPRKGDFIFLSY